MTILSLQNKTVFAIFLSQGNLDFAVDLLREQGISKRDISTLLPSSGRRHALFRQIHQSTSSGLKRGVTGIKDLFSSLAKFKSMAKRYEDDIEAGGILLSVFVTEHWQVARVKMILREAGGIHLAVTDEESIFRRTFLPILKISS